jgi:hypothetical protein
MSSIERAFCRSAPWRSFSSRVVVPWVLEDRTLAGEALELGTGSGAMAEVLLDRFPSLRLQAPTSIARWSRRRNVGWLASEVAPSCSQPTRHRCRSLTVDSMPW